MKNELKQCPFCGGEAHIRTGVTSSVPKVPKAIVICQKCSASTDWFCDKGGNAEFVFEAIEAWNRRADDCNLGIVNPDDFCSYGERKDCDWNG